MNLDSRLFKLIKDLKGTFFLTIFFALLTAIAIIFQAHYLSRIIDLSFLKKQPLENLLPVVLVFVLLVLGRFLSQWISNHFAIQLSSRIRFDLRNHLVNQLHKTSPVYLSLEKRGELTNTLQQGIEALDAYFRSYVPQLFNAAAIPLLILIFVFPIDLLSGIVFLFTAPIIPIFMILIGGLAKRANQRQWKTLSFLSAYLLDMIEGLTTLKILNRSHSQLTRIKTLSEQFRQTAISVLRIAFLSALVLEMAATISTAVIAVEIGLRLLYAKLPFSQALFILILAPEFYQPMRQLGASFHAGMEGFEAAQRIFEIFNFPSRPTVTAQIKEVPKSFIHITFNQVSFTYPGSQNAALKNINFTIQYGKKYVIIGTSGSGKSTLFNLILRFITPTEGEILIDGRNLQCWPEESWFQMISWVPQKAYLFHDTIEANLRLVKPYATQKEIERACQKARLHTFIEQLPEGYQTIVGERGIRLSGGQAQRLALARAFLKNAPIILLDEPTANLDPQLDREIIEIFNQLPKETTQIIIAHRLSTLKSADTILALQNGKLIDSGSYEELLQPGRYLHRMLNNLGRGTR